MLIKDTDLCVTLGSDRAGLQAIHILASTLNRKTETLCGVSLKAPEDSVAFLEVERTNYPSKYVRLLFRDAPELTRAWQERKDLLEQEERKWLTPARLIICINPRQRVGEHYQTLFTRALRELCGIRTVRKRMDGALTPDEKREMRIQAQREYRRAEHRASGGW